MGDDDVGRSGGNGMRREEGAKAGRNRARFGATADDDGPAAGTVELVPDHAPVGKCLEFGARGLFHFALGWCGQSNGSSLISAVHCDAVPV